MADIPLEPDHPSRATLEGWPWAWPSWPTFPALLLWGARDPVFTERYLDDLIDRLPQADVQRYPRAAHLVTEDVPESAGHVWQWVDRSGEQGRAARRVPSAGRLAVGGTAGPGIGRAQRR